MDWDNYTNIVNKQFQSNEIRNENRKLLSTDSEGKTNKTHFETKKTSKKDVNRMKEDLEQSLINLVQREGVPITSLSTSKQDGEKRKPESLLCASNAELNGEDLSPENKSKALDSLFHTSENYESDYLKHSQSNLPRKYPGLYPNSPKLISLDFTYDKQIGNKSKIEKKDNKIISLEARRKPCNWDSGQSPEKSSSHTSRLIEKEITIFHLLDDRRTNPISDVSEVKSFANSTLGFKSINKRLKSTGKTLEMNKWRGKKFCHFTKSTQTMKSDWLHERPKNQTSSKSKAQKENQSNVDASPVSWDNKSFYSVEVKPEAGGPLHQLNLKIPERQSNADLVLTETCKNFDDSLESFENKILLTGSIESLDLLSINPLKNLEAMEVSTSREGNGEVQETFKEHSISIYVNEEKRAIRDKFNNSS